VGQGLIDDGGEREVEAVGSGGGGCGGEDDLRAGGGCASPGDGEGGFSLVGGEAGVCSDGENLERGDGKAEGCTEGGDVAGGDVAAGGYGDGLAFAVGAGGVEGVEVKKLGGKLRGEGGGVAEGCLSSEVGCRDAEGLRRGESGRGKSAVERDEAVGDRGERGGDGDGLGEDEAGSGRGGDGVNLSVKCQLELGGGAGEFDPGAAGREGGNLKTLALEPLSDGGDIGWGVGEGVSEGGRSEPFVVLGRGGIELGGE